jgi:hypothetical protein
VITTIDFMTALTLAKFVPTTVAAAIGLGALMTVGAPLANASEKSDCDKKGGTYSETTITDNGTGKPGTVYSCCVKDAQTNTTSCSSTTVTKATRNPGTIAPGSIVGAENAQPNPPIQRVPLHVLSSDVQIQQAP